MTLTDYYSRYTWVYFLHHKSEASQTFKSFKQKVENTTSKKIFILRSDPGGEFLSNEFQQFCHSQGIIRQLTTAHTRHQNGVTERKNRTLLEMVRSLSFGGSIPSKFLEELVCAANYIINISCTRALNWSTSFQSLTGSVPDVGHFSIIGSSAYVHIPKDLQHKLGSQSITTVLVGYNDSSIAYGCFDPQSNKILISHDVVFDESILGNFTIANPQQADILTKIIPRTNFEFHRKSLGMKSLEELQRSPCNH